MFIQLEQCFIYSSVSKHKPQYYYFFPIIPPCIPHLSHFLLLLLLLLLFIYFFFSILQVTFEMTKQDIWQLDLTVSNNKQPFMRDLEY